MGREALLVASLVLMWSTNVFALFRPWDLQPSSDMEQERRGWQILASFPKQSESDFETAFDLFQEVIDSAGDPRSAYCGAGQAAVYKDPPDFEKAIVYLMKC